MTYTSSNSGKLTNDGRSLDGVLLRPRMPYPTDHLSVNAPRPREDAPRGRRPSEVTMSEISAAYADPYPATNAEHSPTTLGTLTADIDPFEYTFVDKIKDRVAAFFLTLGALFVAIYKKITH